MSVDSKALSVEVASSLVVAVLEVHRAHHARQTSWSNVGRACLGTVVRQLAVVSLLADPLVQPMVQRVLAVGSILQNQRPNQVWL